MPELPEVESIKRQLKPNIVGKIISDIKILSPKNFIGNKGDVIGRKIISVDRYGKVLVLKFDKFYLNIHFKLSGQILFPKTSTKPFLKILFPLPKEKSCPPTQPE